MQIPWGSFWQKSRKQLKTGWLITAGLIAIYLGSVGPMNEARRIAAERATGLAARSEWQTLSKGHQTHLGAKLEKGTAAGVPGRLADEEQGAVDTACVCATG